MAAHAILSASTAHQWLACPPSARATADIPDKGSVYAAEGTLAHAIAELKLRKYLTEPMGARTFNARMKKLKADESYQEEMQRFTDVYFDFVKESVMAFHQKPYAAVEKRVDFSHVVPEGFGTCDCILIGGSVMHVLDFKYGKGVPVSAEENPQMKLYALGALWTYGMIYPVQTIKLSIVQPRLDSISTWDLTAQELKEWGETVVRPTAQLAFEGKGEFHAGPHCRFCKLKGNCRARAEEAFAMVPMAEKPKESLTLDEVAQALEKADFLQGWAKDLQEYALTSILDGGSIPGWKAVHGRSIRRFKDMDSAFKALVEAGVDEALLFERKPLTLAAIEKVVGKQAFAEAAGAYIETPPGKPTLAPETDKREAITGITAEEAFKGI